MKTQANNNTIIHRLRWKCRRGMLELDQLLLNFLDNKYTQLSENEQQLFDILLDESDRQLWNWFLVGEIPSDKQTAAMIKQILAVMQTSKEREFK